MPLCAASKGARLLRVQYLLETSTSTPGSGDNEIPEEQMGERSVALVLARMEINDQLDLAAKWRANEPNS